MLNRSAASCEGKGYIRSWVSSLGLTFHSWDSPFPLRYVLVDTPGQIEVFTWSASGNLVTDMLASSFPTLLLYVVDTPRARSPVTFMSNMLYACSILYKTRLPFVLCFNKSDVTPHDFAIEWMSDYDAFQVRNDLNMLLLSRFPHRSRAASSLCLTKPTPTHPDRRP